MDMPAGSISSIYLTIFKSLRRDSIELSNIDIGTPSSIICKKINMCLRNNIEEKKDDRKYHAYDEKRKSDTFYLNTMSYFIRSLTTGH
jgi:hypothetical protein